LLEKELLEEDALRRLELISKTLQEKCTLLQTLDESILAVCPTEEIEGEILEAEDLTDKIAQLRLEISSVIVPKVDISGIRSTEGVNKSKDSHESTETCEPTALINKMSAPGDSESKHESTPPTVVTNSESKSESTPPVVSDKGEGASMLFNQSCQNLYCQDSTETSLRFGKLQEVHQGVHPTKRPLLRISAKIYCMTHLGSSVLLQCRPRFFFNCCVHIRLVGMRN